MRLTVDPFVPAVILLSIIICILFGCVLRDLRHDLDEAESKRQEMSRKATEQAESLNELPGIVRRLGVRVGRLEEKQNPPQP